MDGGRAVAVPKGVGEVRARLPAAPAKGGGSALRAALVQGTVAPRGVTSGCMITDACSLKGQPAQTSSDKRVPNGGRNNQQCAGVEPSARVPRGGRTKGCISSMVLAMSWSWSKCAACAAGRRKRWVLRRSAAATDGRGWGGDERLRGDVGRAAGATPCTHGRGRRATPLACQRAEGGQCAPQAGMVQLLYCGPQGVGGRWCGGESGSGCWDGARMARGRDAPAGAPPAGRATKQAHQAGSGKSANNPGTAAYHAATNSQANTEFEC